MKPYNIIVILGPTASGKTRLAVNVAATINSEIISADSRQVYRGMNVGTGKDLEEYQINKNKIPYHLIDIRNAGDDYNLNEYINDFKIAFEKITNENKIPILCGGTGLYIDAVLKGYEYTGIPINEKLRNEIKDKSLEELQQLFTQLPVTSYHKVADTSTHKRMIRAIEIVTWLDENKNYKASSIPNLKPAIFGLASERENRRTRIEQRLQHRLQNGLIEEVELLLKKGISEEKLIFYGLEYKFVVQHLQKEITYDYLVEHLTIAIQQFAKRQMTYFRKIEREGLLINWIDSDLSLEEQIEIVKEGIGEFGY
jgi:tRNA dimethylallyltransferase